METQIPGSGAVSAAVSGQEISGGGKDCYHIFGHLLMEVLAGIRNIDGTLPTSLRFTVRSTSLLSYL